MTPSEIADWLDDRAMALGTSTIAYQQAAATIRAQAEALKIATEALERIGMMPLSLAECIAESHQALARIKEV